MLAIACGPEQAAIYHFNFGVELQGKGQLDAAIVEYRKAIELDPNLAAAHDGLGIVAFKLENVADVRATPAVDALIRVAGGADIARARAQRPHDGVLRRVGVLVFVLVLNTCTATTLSPAIR